MALIKLGTGDAAVIFRKNGSTDLRFHKQKDNEAASDPNYAALITATLFQHNDLVELVHERMRVAIAQDMEKKNAKSV